MTLFFRITSRRDHYYDRYNMCIHIFHTQPSNDTRPTQPRLTIVSMSSAVAGRNLISPCFARRSGLMGSDMAGNPGGRLSTAMKPSGRGRGAVVLAGDDILGMSMDAANMNEKGLLSAGEG